MNARRSLWGVAVAALVIAAPAAAQESVNHVYAGAMLGQSHWRSACPGQADCDDEVAGLRVFGGYQISKIFAAEIGFDNLGAPANVKATAWELVGVAAWPLFNALSVYGKLGIYRGNAEGSGTLLGAKETNYGPTYGIGAQFDIGRNLALRADWQAYPSLGGSTLPKMDVNLLSAGALWRFR